MEIFDLDRFQQRSSVAIIVGCRGSGKSALIRELIQRCSGSAPNTTIVAAHGGDAYVGHEVAREYSPTLVVDALFAQRQRREQNDVGGGMMVLDDVFFSDKMINDCQGTTMAFKNGRHWNMKTVVAMQYPLHLSPDMITNVDLVFMFFVPTTSARRRMYDLYGGQHFFGTFDAFDAALCDATADFGCLVLDRTNEPQQVWRYRTAERQTTMSQQQLQQPLMTVDDRILDL